MLKNEIAEMPKKSPVYSVEEWLQILAANFNRDLSELQLMAYREALKDLTPEQAHQACSRALLECKFMPPVAELREFASMGQKAATNRVTMAAETEWEAIDKHVARYGGTVYPSDPPLALTAAGEYAFRRIGWRLAVADAGPGDLHWLHKNFVEAYVLYADTDGLKALPQNEARRLLDGLRKALPAGEPKGAA